MSTKEVIFFIAVILMYLFILSQATSMIVNVYSILVVGHYICSSIPSPPYVLIDLLEQYARKTNTVGGMSMFICEYPFWGSLAVGVITILCFVVVAIIFVILYARETNRVLLNSTNNSLENCNYEESK